MIGSSHTTVRWGIGCDYEVQLAYDHLDAGDVQLGDVQLSVEAHL